jgi:hypothetical protein
LEDTTLAPDPQDNPLGIFLREGSLDLRNNVQITGTLIVTDDLAIKGSNVHIQPADLNAIGNSGPVRLPALVVGDDLQVFSGVSATLKGVGLVWDETEVKDGTQTTDFRMQGRLITKDFRIGPRQEWQYDSSTWSTLYALFQFQLGGVNTIVQFFPDYMSLLGRRPEPKIVFAPDATTRLDHLPLSLESVYAPAAGDAGLRWELLDWKDEGS